MAQFDIVIPIYVQDQAMADMTFACIESIYLQATNERIIVVDNGSPYEGMAALRENIDFYFSEQDGDMRLWLTMPENIGFIKGTNVGIAASTAPFVVLQNNDTIVYDDIYSRMAKVCSQEGVGVVGPCSSGGWQDVAKLGRMWPAYRDLRLIGQPPQQIAYTLAKAFKGQLRPCGGEHGMVAFFCAMMRREVIQEVGYLSESFGVGLGDDDDYCARLKQAGYSAVLAMDCYCHHYHRTTFNALYTNKEISDMQHDAMDLLHKRYEWKATT
jgi:GT2 family glycosyltransferase